MLIIRTAFAASALSLAALAVVAPAASQSSESPVPVATSSAVFKATFEPVTEAVVKPVIKAAVVPLSPQAHAVRARLRTDTTRWNGQPVETLDEASRILLSQAAAKEAGLEKVGLTYEDVYGIIEAETSWIARTGASKDGTPNLGLAQFEPRTAELYGVQDPSDPVQAVFGAARYMKHAAAWAAERVGDLKLPPAEHAAKVREGVSIYYNLSVKGRNKWDGLNTAQLPIETQRHIRNARAGAEEARQLRAQLLKA